MTIDKFSKVPIYEQIISEFERQIVSGILSPGDKLPSVRSLSTEITINPNTIQKAYAELERLGITSSSQGQGRFVTMDAGHIIRDQKKSALSEINRLIDELIESGVNLEEIFRDIRAMREEKKNL